MESTTPLLQLHSSQLLARRNFNRLFASVYSLAIAALFYHHAKTLIFSSPSSRCFLTALPLLLSDLILSFMWVNLQAFRMNPVVKKPFPENLTRVLSSEDYPALDIFICTADADKEPPIKVAATALSVMAYDYPPDKLSVYVSDDGGSELTLFALAEAAAFGKEWLPFCKKNLIMERCPDAYFARNHEFDPQVQKMKMLYDAMKSRTERVVEKGFIADRAQAFQEWAKGGFTIQDHPPVIKVLSQSRDDKDVANNPMPNLIYVSREKNKAIPHHFKAGALNVLLRVSSIMTNAPMILTLDCDMISNDPKTPHQMLCYFMDSSIKPTLGYLQFPPCFEGVNKRDTYASNLTRVYHINPLGMNGLLGPDCFGTGTFFSRRAFHGGPSSIIEPELAELSPNHVPGCCLTSEPVLDMVHKVASCTYENQTNWGSKIGFRYGSLVEDYYTGFRLHCEGWKSIFCDPKRPAFISEMPISLNDVVTQQKRWSVGLLEVVFSKHSPLIFGARSFGSLMAHCYSYYAFGPSLSFPIAIYATLPQATMLNNISIFPKVSDRWFLLYVFLFLGAYGQDVLEFVSVKGTLARWWSDQRMWLIRGLSSDLFGTVEYIGNHLGIAARGFNVTAKVNDEQQRKRYDEGKFEFGVASPMFVPLSTAAILNLAAFAWGMFGLVSKGKGFDEFIGQMLIAGFGVVNSLPVYEAIIWRRDEGRMPTKISGISVFLAWVIFVMFSLV